METKNSATDKTLSLAKPFSPTEWDSHQPGHQLLRVALWIAALSLGAADAWVSRYTMYPDGISYLDLGDALWRGDWHNAINGYWNPLYPAIVGFFFKIFKPPLHREYPFVHAVNFGIYVVALVCFDFFLRRFIEVHTKRNARSATHSEIGVPIWGWYVAGYSIFVSSSLFLISTSFVSGDMVIAAVVYLAFALILNVRSGNANWRTFALLGVVLGAGYLTKTVMFLLAIPFILTACAHKPSSKTLKQAAVGFAFFALIAGPFVVALSIQKGRLTFGDSGTINYLINVDRGQFYIPRQADAKHAMRNLGFIPEAYEYAKRVSGTYPLWYDPSYWHEGIHPHFTFKLQLRAIALSLASCAWILFNPWLGLDITVAILALYMTAPSPYVCVKHLRAYWHLWVPAITGICLYCLVVVEYRYVGAFFGVLWMIGMAGVRLPQANSSRRIISGAVCLLAITTLATAMRQIAREAGGADFVERRIATAEIPRIAELLQSYGVQPGDKLAVVSDWLFPSREGAYVCRLARAQIIGEVRPQQFWSADETTRAKLIEIYKNAGAKALFAYEPSRVEPGWERLGSSNYYLYLMRSKAQEGRTVKDADRAPH